MPESFPKENVYICQKCGGLTVTVDVDEGVTPYVIECRAGVPKQFMNTKGTIRKKCAGTALSSFYPEGPRPSHIPAPAWEWYKPTDAELAALYHGDLLEDVREYVSKGGLELRRRTNKEPIMYDRSAHA